MHHSFPIVTHPRRTLCLVLVTLYLYVVPLSGINDLLLCRINYFRMSICASIMVLRGFHFTFYHYFIEPACQPAGQAHCPLGVSIVLHLYIQRIDAQLYEAVQQPIQSTRCHVFEIRTSYSFRTVPSCPSLFRRCTSATRSIMTRVENLFFGPL